MRIDLNSVPQGSAAQKSEKSSAGKRAQLNTTDNASLPEDKVSLSSLVQQALQVPPMREDKIESLRAAILSGQYSINTNQIAAAILASTGE